jgi:hypothetical protein
MGAWGPSLYSNDLGLDLRSAIKVVSRLPFEVEQLTEIAIDTFRETAKDSDDDDYTTFWLVLADLFHRRGIPAKAVFNTAIGIIKSGKDLQVNQDLGMSGVDLEKRRYVLAQLQERLEQAVPTKSRNILKKPQPLLMSLGDVIVFPIDKKGGSINPYFSTKQLEQSPRLKFEKSGWGAAVIIACGRAFDFISYYTPIVITKHFNAIRKPTFDLIEKHEGWRLNISGTCSKNHFRRMQLEIIGKVTIDEIKLRRSFHRIDNGVSAAVNDISLANRLKVFEEGKERQGSTLERLSQITSK